ncbi:MAG: hypothetical protein ACKVW3_01250 [Phycisphaerales bacterium]
MNMLVSQGLKAILVCITAIAAIVQAGCSSGSLQLEPGTTAYAGSSVDQHELWIERQLSGSASNAVDIESARGKGSTRFEKIKVYVDPPVIEDLSRSKVVYTSEELRSLLERGTSDSITQFSRFERVVSRERAQLIVAARLVSVNAWADTFMKKDEANSLLGRPGERVASEVSERVSREAIDCNVTVSFSRPDGTVFTSATALGRLVGTKGVAITSADYISAGGRGGKGKSYLEATNAKLNDEEVKRSLQAAVDGALAVAILRELDRDLWEKADASYYRRVRSGVNSAESRAEGKGE